MRDTGTPLLRRTLGAFLASAFASASPWIVGLVAAVLAGLASLLSLKFWAAPYVWICVSWLVVCLLLAIRVERSAWRVLALTIAGSLFVAGGFELALYLGQPGRAVRSELSFEEGGPQHRTEAHDLLGRAPPKGLRARWRRYSGDRLMFDVSYRINGLGLRHVPSSRSTADRCILFFGGSFTFGDGVNDQETLANVVGLRTGRRFRILNFGYSAYGPHQMLAMLERGEIVQDLACRPIYVFYHGVRHHVHRVAGKVSWAYHEPRYVLNDAGEVVYQGPFWRRGSLAAQVRKQVVKSRIVTRVLHRVTDQDIALTVAVVDQARNFVERRFPGATFHVIFWDKRDSALSDKLVAGYQARGLRLHRISNILPGYREADLRYRLDPDDRHPNALAYNLIADYIGRAIIAD